MDKLRKHFRNLANTTSTTPDRIPVIVFKKLDYSVCEPLRRIFRRSLEGGTLPELFSTAIIRPEHKKSSKADVANQRPVSLTVIASKLIKSVIATDIYIDAYDQDRISEAQFAYCKWTLQLLETQINWAKNVQRLGLLRRCALRFQACCHNTFLLVATLLVAVCFATSTQALHPDRASNCGHTVGATNSGPTVPSNLEVAGRNSQDDAQLANAKENDDKEDTFTTGPPNTITVTNIKPEFIPDRPVVVKTLSLIHRLGPAKNK